MPLYEYTCTKCHKSFELLIRGEEKPKCPHCGSEKLEKQYSSFCAKDGKGHSDCGDHHHCCGGNCCCHGGH